MAELDAKLIGAAAIMVVGLGALGYRLMPEGRGGHGDRAPAPVASAIDDAGEAVDTNYTPIGSVEDARESMEALGARVALRSGDIEGVGSAGAAVAAAARSSIEPFLTGSYEDFIAGVESMGGTIDPEGDRSRLFDMLSEWFELGDPDLDRLEVGPYEPDRPEGMGRRGGMEYVSREDADETFEGGADTPRTRMSVQQMRLQPASLFPGVGPDSQVGSGPAPIQVSVPIRPTGGPHKGGDVSLGVTLYWNGETGSWQPGMYDITIRSVDEEGGAP